MRSLRKSPTCHGSVDSIKPPWKGKMGKQYRYIAIAWMFATLPMLLLATDFLLAVELSKPPDDQDTYYLVKGGEKMPMSTALFSTIPSTQLTFIASFSATLATALLPASMALMSYSTACSICQNSDRENSEKLASPYQLDLLIRFLNGNIIALWNFACHMLGTKRRKVPVVSSLWKAMLLLGALILLTILISAADVWLNFTVSTVQYTTNRPVPPGDYHLNLIYSPLCYDTGDMRTRYGNGAFVRHWDENCDPKLLQRKRPSWDQALKTTETSKRAGILVKKLEINQLQDGIVGTFLIPDRLARVGVVKLVASTFGCSTFCRFITDLCDPRSGRSGKNQSETRYTDIGTNVEYNCELGSAGVPLSGDFARFEDSNPPCIRLSSSRATPMRAQIIGGQRFFSRSMYVSNKDFEDQFAKGRDKPDHSPGDQVPTSLGLVPYGRYVGGILSCSSSLADVTYSYADEQIRVESWKNMTPPAVHLFREAISHYHKLRLEEFQRRIQEEMARNITVKDIASAIAVAYDKTILSLNAGAMAFEPPHSTSERFVSQVTRMPRVPFLTLIFLNIVYAAIGTCLMIAAVRAVRSGEGVNDAQVRLSTQAIVAESFENPALGDDADDIDRLFAERRGLPTRRIALAKNALGGRRYKQIVLPLSKMGA